MAEPIAIWEQETDVRRVRSQRVFVVNAGRVYERTNAKDTLLKSSDLNQRERKRYFMSTLKGGVLNN